MTQYTIVSEAITPAKSKLIELPRGSYFLLSNELFILPEGPTINNNMLCIGITGSRASLPKELIVQPVNITIYLTEIEEQL